MMGEGTASAHIRRAGERVKTAADQWNAADFSSIANSVTVLECSADSLTAAFKILRQSHENRGNTLRGILVEIKKDARRLQRLVDASAAFLRGLPGAEAADTGFYQSDGLPQGLSSISEDLGIQG